MVKYRALQELNGDMVLASDIQYTGIFFIGNHQNDPANGRALEVFDDFTGIRAAARSKNGNVFHEILRSANPQ